MKTTKINAVPVRSSEITPKPIYMSRRQFMKVAGTVIGSAAASALLAACKPSPSTPTAPASQPTPLASRVPVTPLPTLGAKTDELGDPLTSFDDITHYNNYYEFTTSKEGVNNKAKDFQTSPW